MEGDSVDGILIVGGKTKPRRASHFLLSEVFDYPHKEIADFFVAVLAPRNTDKFVFKAEFAMVNGMPGFVTSRMLPMGLWTFEIEDGKILRFFGQRNPYKFEKLFEA